MRRGGVNLTKENELFTQKKSNVMMDSFTNMQAFYNTLLIL